MHASDIDYHTAADDRRIVLGTTDEPVAAAEVVLLVPAVPEHAVVAKVVERVEVRAAVRVHLDCVTRIRVRLEQLGVDAGQAVDDRAIRRVRHPDVVDRIAGGDPGRHALEVIDGEVEDLGSVEARQQLGLPRRIHPVETTDLVVFPPRALRYLSSFDGLHRLKYQPQITAHDLAPLVGFPEASAGCHSASRVRKRPALRRPALEARHGG